VTLSSAEARRRLNLERYWCIYALGDLDPRREEFCTWFGDEHGDSVALVYREFDTPIVFAGDPELGSAGLLEAMEQVNGSCFFQIPSRCRDMVDARFTFDWIRSMHRLRIHRSEFKPADYRHASLLTGAHEAELRALYSDGHETHEAPDFFFASQLHDETFHGIRLDDGTLVAAGGTHLYCKPESIGAIGNIYTHRAHRGKGFGAAVTSAIANCLFERGIETIALNVKQDNAAARRLYERLGFRHCGDYLEGLAHR
jgi:ribosomal protein S18 acetylase RimI-like enzyme